MDRRGRRSRSLAGIIPIPRVAARHGSREIAFPHALARHRLAPRTQTRRREEASRRCGRWGLGESTTHSNTLHSTESNKAGGGGAHHDCLEFWNMAMQVPTSHWLLLRARVRTEEGNLAARSPSLVPTRAPECTLTNPALVWQLETVCLVGPCTCIHTLRRVNCR